MNDAFDIADATVFGGIVGFVEESIRAEEDIDDIILDDTIEEYIDGCSDRTMQLLYNQNPGLVNYLIRKAYKERHKVSKSQEEEIQAIYKEMEEEIENLKHV